MSFGSATLPKQSGYSNQLNYQTNIFNLQKQTSTTVKLGEKLLLY